VFYIVKAWMQKRGRTCYTPVYMYQRDPERIQIVANCIEAEGSWICVLAILCFKNYVSFKFWCDIVCSETMWNEYLIPLCCSYAQQNGHYYSYLCWRLKNEIYSYLVAFILILRLNWLCILVVRIPGYRSRGPVFDSRRYHIFWRVMVLERGPLSLQTTIEGLQGKINSSSVLECREYGFGDPLRWPCNTLYLQNLH
jgi:hypothetical protein